MLSLIALLIIALVLCTFIITGFTGAPWVPTKTRDIVGFLVAAKVGPGVTYCDLGCGNGTTLVLAARAGATVIGVERNPFLWAIAKLRLRQVKGARVVLGDLWTFSVSDIDVVMVFLMPKFMSRLDAKLAKELRPGARVISYTFEIPGRQPIKKSSSTYLYQY